MWGGDIVSRVKKVKKRKWINGILNVLIVFVGMGICVVSYYSFLQPVEAQPIPSEPTIEENEEKEKDVQEEVVYPSKEKLVWIREKMDNSNVIETYEDPNWKVIQTNRSAQKEVNYGVGSNDWIEMRQCIAYATDLSLKDFSTWYIGPEGKENYSVAVISTKDGAYHYRIYIELVEEGWLPLLVQQIRKPIL